MTSFSAKENKTTALKQIYNTIIKIVLSYGCYIMLKSNRWLLKYSVIIVSLGLLSVMSDMEQICTTDAESKPWQYKQSLS